MVTRSGMNLLFGGVVEFGGGDSSLADLLVFALEIPSTTNRTLKFGPSTTDVGNRGSSFCDLP